MLDCVVFRFVLLYLVTLGLVPLGFVTAFGRESSAIKVELSNNIL